MNGSTRAVTIEPYTCDVAASGQATMNRDQIDDLIKLLVTISARWGNTAVKYHIRWGGSALWAEDEQKQEIDKLKKKNAALQRKVKRLKEMA